MPGSSIAIGLQVAKTNSNEDKTDSVDLSMTSTAESTGIYESVEALKSSSLS